MVALIFFLTKFKSTTSLERLSDTLLWVDKRGAETGDWRDLMASNGKLPETFGELMDACADHVEGTSRLKLVPDVLAAAGADSTQSLREIRSWATAGLVRKDYFKSVGRGSSVRWAATAATFRKVWVTLRDSVKRRRRQPKRKRR